VPLTDETTAINGQFQYLLSDTVWKNYIMNRHAMADLFPCTADQFQRARACASQDRFDKQPDITDCARADISANSTLETFSQGTIPQASSSCHGLPWQRDRFSAALRQRRERSQREIHEPSDFTFIAGESARTFAIQR